MKFLNYVLLDVTEPDCPALNEILKKHGIFTMDKPQNRLTPFVGTPDGLAELISECWSSCPSEYHARMVPENFIKLLKLEGNLISFSAHEKRLHRQEAHTIEIDFDEGVSARIGERVYYINDLLEKINSGEFINHGDPLELVNSILSQDVMFGTLGTIEKALNGKYDFVAYNGESKHNISLHEVSYNLVTGGINLFDAEEARKELSAILQKLTDDNKKIIGDSERKEMLSLVDSFFHEKKN